MMADALCEERVDDGCDTPAAAATSLPADTLNGPSASSGNPIPTTRGTEAGQPSDPVRLRWGMDPAHTQGMTLPAGTIVVANPDAFGGAGGLIAVNPSNGQQTTLSQGGMFVEPSNVAIAADGRIYVSDHEAFSTGGLIAVDPTNGQQTKIAASTVFQFPAGIVVDAGGQVVVAYMQRVQGLGAVLRVNPANGDHTNVAPGVKFSSPYGVAFDANGNLLVTDPDFHGAFDPALSFQTHLFRIDQGVGASILAHRTPPGRSIYWGIAIEHTGNILVVNNTNGPERELLRFHPTTGAMTKVAAGNKLVNHFGVAVEANGAIMVIDKATGLVRVDPATGTQTTVSTGGNLAGPSGGGPSGVAVQK
jgi:sugar lactone lactonase YvrE